MFRIEDLGFMDKFKGIGLGFRVKGLRFRV